MSDLVKAIRDSLRDHRLDSSEIDDLLARASQDGVTADDLNQIVSACEQSVDGFTPAMRAQLVHGLTAYRATDALKALQTKKPNTEGWHKLAEVQASLEILAREVATLRTRWATAGQKFLELADAAALAKGQLVPAPGHDNASFRNLKQGVLGERDAYLKAKAALEDALSPLSALEREALMASADSNASRTWQDVRLPLGRFEVLTGLSNKERVAATSALALPTVAAGPKHGKSSSFLDIEFTHRIAWKFDAVTNTLQLPPDTSLKNLGNLGDIHVEGRNIGLPGGATLNGDARLRGGQIQLHCGATLASNVVKLTCTGEDARVKLNNDTLVAGPKVRIDLPLAPLPAKDSPEAKGVETKKLKFALTEGELPDGTLVRQGRGELMVMVKDGVPIAVVEGSIKLDADATVVRQGPVTFACASGEPGEIKCGSVVLKDGRPIGFGRNTDALVDGISVQTSDGDFTSYRFSPPNSYELGEGAVVSHTPPDREIKLQGVDLRVGPQRFNSNAIVDQGGVTIVGDRFTGVLPNTTVSFKWGKVENGDTLLPIFDGKGTKPARGNLLAFTLDKVEIRGAGIKVSGNSSDASAMLRARGNDVFGRTERLSLETGDNGSMTLTRADEPGKAARFDVELSGDASVTSGRWTLRANDPTHPEVAKDNLGGPSLRVKVGQGVYEIDTRPLWQEEGVTGDTGRFREVPLINNPTLFGGELERQTCAIFDGRQTLKRGASGELVKRVQRALGQALSRPSLAADGSFGADTAEAVRGFQRLSLLPVTGVVDAATLHRLDDVATPDLAHRPKVMVMLMFNNTVPDERKRFRTLAAERGATPVIIGPPPPEGETDDVNALSRYFAKAERGEIDFDWLVISGHSGGTSTWGENSAGTWHQLSYDTLAEWAATFPRAAGEIEKMQLLNCYNVTRDRVESLWKPMFPNVIGMGGFMYSAPGEKAQSSDENLLYTGRDLMRIPKGAVPDQALANEITHNYITNRFIMPQNASVWMRYQDASGKEQEYFKLTPSAEYEMRKHGAGDELTVEAFQQRQTFNKYLAAQEPGFEKPPADPNTGPLREYLNAVDGVLGRWLRRAREYHALLARQQRDPSFQMPEEYADGWNTPDRQVQSLQKTRAQVLFLIDFTDVVHRFEQRYGAVIAAFNKVLEENKIPDRFPTGDALKAMSRKQILAMLDKLTDALDRLPSQVSSTLVENNPAWRMMVGNDEAVTEPTSPAGLLGRANAFLRELDSDYMKVEWL